MEEQFLVHLSPADLDQDRAEFINRPHYRLFPGAEWLFTSFPGSHSNVQELGINDDYPLLTFRMGRFW
jgi:hypothetical protein